MAGFYVDPGLAACALDSRKLICWRHVLVDTLGNLLKVFVTAANIADGKAAIELFEQLPQALFKCLKHIRTDGSYRGEFVEWVAEKFKKIVVDITLCSDDHKGFQVVREGANVEELFRMTIATS